MRKKRQIAMSKPLAVIIGDIHFTVPTLELATAALKAAINVADDLNIPLIVNGDTCDTKGLLQARVVNRLIDIFHDAAPLLPRLYVNVGNHDLVHEKSSETALNFLHPYVTLVERETFVYPSEGELLILPYNSNPDNLAMRLRSNEKPSPTPFLVVHQGVQTAYMGHYAQDKTSLPPEAYAAYRTIGSHYHRRQDILCGDLRKRLEGAFSYIGNPYTLNFGEANDPQKSFAILKSDGNLEHVHTNLRKHVIIETTLQNPELPPIIPGDLIWVKLHGSAYELEKVSKAELGEKWFGHLNFKLDKYPDDKQVSEGEKEVTQTPWQMLDDLIDHDETNPDNNQFLKALAREALDETNSN